MGSRISLSDKVAEDIISALDEYATDEDEYTYGLPTHDEHMKKLITLILQLAKKESNLNKLAVSIINALDNYATDFSEYEMGLPNYDAHMKKMINIVVKLIK